MTPLVVLLGVLLLAVNLRASLAAYPPLLLEVRRSLGISAGAAGLVQTAAVVAMGLGSFPALAIAARIGRERAAGVALGCLLVGSLVRGVPTVATLVLGSVLVGAGIGLSGVLLTGIVKHHLPHRAGAASGAYVAVMLIGATTASAIAVPVAASGLGWSGSLAVWALPAALALAAWTPIAVRAGGSDRSASGLPWRNQFALRTAGYFATASVQFYGWLTWLAPYYEDSGWDAHDAALLLSLFSLAQIPVALTLPALAERSRWGAWAAVTVAVTLVATVGVLLAPAPGPVVVVLVVLLAVGVGGGFPLGLALIAGRTPDAPSSEAVGSLCLGFGYLVAGVAPLGMGVLHDVTDSYVAPLLVVLVTALVQGALVLTLRNPGVHFKYYQPR